MITAQDQQQWGYLLDPCFQLVNTAGKPLTNGYLEVYIAGSRVKYYCASDFTGTLHPFQIPLDSLGSNIVLADPANSYDVYVYNAFGTLLMSRYNVKVSAANAQGGGSAPVTSATVPAMFLGEYGVQVPVLENQTGLPLPLPKGEYNTYTHNADEIIDHYDSEGLYMYLKPGVFFVNATIRFRQNRDNIKNKVTNIKIFTGNGNWNEANVNKIDCTGQHAEDDYNYIHCTFIRVNDSEDTDFGRFSSGILYFRPLVYDSSWSECSIQRLEIVKLNTIGGEGGQSYIPGDYVSIVGNVISVTGVLPESATGDFVQYEEFNTEIQNIHNEIDNLEITVQNATAQIVEQTTEIVTSVVEEVAPPMVTSIIERELAGVTGEFATRDELESATANLQDQIDNIEPNVQSDWTEDDPDDPSYIKNKPEEEEVEFEEVDLSVYATKDELQSATSEIINVIETVTGNVPTGTVTHEELENATSVLQNEIDNIPAQVQSDWMQTATGEPDYIKNKPEVLPLVAGQNIAINEVNGEIVISAEGATGDYVERDELENVTSQIESEIENVSSNIPELPEEEEVEFEELDLSDYATVSELETVTANVLEQATGAIPAQVQSDWTESDSSDPSYIQNKPTELSLVEGTNIHITKSGNEVIISADNGATGAVTQSELATATANLQTEIETVTGDVIDTVTSMIPAAQVQSDWAETDTSDPSYIQNKPSEKTLVEGQNVHITASGDYIVISADGGQVTGDYVERDELEAVTAEVLDQATANVPAQVQSDWTQTVTGDPSYIKHKPDTLPLVAGDNVTIDEVNGEIVISAQGGVTGDFVETSELEAATAEIQDEIATATSQIPSPVVINYGDAIPSNIDLYYLTSQKSIPVCVKVPYNQLPADIKNKVYDYSSNYVYLWYKAQFLEPYGSDYSQRWVFETVLSAPNFKYPSVDTSAYILRVHTTSNGSTWSIDSIKLADSQVVVAHVTIAGTTPGSAVTSDITASDFINAWKSGKAVYAIDTSPSYDVYSIVQGSNTDAYPTLILATVSFSTNVKQLYVTGGGWAKYTPDLTLVTSNTLSSYATKSWVNDQGFLTEVPTGYVTEEELEAVTASFPSTDNLATKAEVAAATGEIQADIETVSSMITPELPVVGGTGIGITETSTEITISVTGDYVTSSELATATAAVESDIPDTSDMATKTWVGNQGYLTSVPATYITESELATATAAVEGDIPDTSNLATKTEVTAGLNGKQSTLTGITDVQVVQSLPASPVATVLYLIPEA